MSSQRGNTERTRPQKHKNRSVFKNDVHGKTPLRKIINNIQVTNVCVKCKHIIEWKIKYKKYKPIKAAKKCTKCDEKTVKHAYHIMCSPCAHKLNVCPKCGKNEEIVEKTLPVEEQMALDLEMQQTIKRLSERKRRTFLRYMSKARTERPSDNAESESQKDLTLDDVKAKLAALKVESESGDEFDDDSDFDDIDDNGDDDDDDEDADDDISDTD